MDSPLAYHINDVAKLTGIGRTKLYEAIRDGQLKAKKFGSRTLVPADALKTFMAALPDMSVTTGLSK